ncbi:hypothetical protein AeNC1_011763 [Aphanomyces euteiches]|nr:hypothetical protein AeNC1_011763 [Aphanomyces euteiches]
MPPRTQYSVDDLTSVIEDVIDMTKTIRTAAVKYNIPQRTLRYHVSKVKTNSATRKSMGPDPILPLWCETDLVTWILVMEKDGHPLSCPVIIERATEMLERVQEYSRPTKLTTGWYQRFLSRHREIKTVKANVITKPRQSIDETTIDNFYKELLEAMKNVDMDPSRVFNMDETSFTPSSTAKKVVVHRSTKQVYVEEPSASSHVTIVACVGADGTKIPPLFVLPGNRVSIAFCDSLTLPGAAVTTSDKGWTNSFICRKLLSMLDKAIPSNRKRPILLIVDGCSSHYSTHIYEESQRLGILLLFLPSNSTHLFQPLDVTLFRPFKQAVRREITDEMWWGDSNTILKHEAISISCRVWAHSTKASSITNGFFCTGLFPPSIEKMKNRLSLFRPPQGQVDELDGSWIQRRDIMRNDILVLPPKKKKRGLRKTVTVSGKFITAEYHDILQAQRSSQVNTLRCDGEASPNSSEICIV